MNTQEEILDLVSPEDIVIGQAPRSEIYAKKLDYIRVINAFLINSEGFVWIPRRHASKKLFPSRLDCSVGGHVSSGETYEKALFRGTQEELNINLKDMLFREIAYLKPLKDNISAFCKLYAIYSDSDPDYNQDDFVSAEWLFPKEVIERIKAGEKAKGDLPTLIEVINKKIILQHKM